MRVLNNNNCTSQFVCKYKFEVKIPELNKLVIAYHNILYTYKKNNIIQFFLKYLNTSPHYL